MSRHMLIDAAHPEETRVVVLDGGRLEEFDFESSQRKQLRGNIYLAKVARVEPSLQAAFIDYGGNRHGFLAFNEIHPDYYQIPHADREALMREARAGGESDDEEHPPLAAAGGGANGDDEVQVAAHADQAGPADQAGHLDQAGHVDDEDEIDEDIARQRRRLMRRYKIQEVIKRRQIMLVQVVKEERGNKGAALTTYLSLAGRYCVLMPNTDRGGGISRKITAAADRKRLREVVAEFDVPQGMGLIVRTAGAKRTRAEIRRDYEYLSRAWGEIRDTTLRSIAPALIYEEEDLVKRAIRDLFDKDIEAIWVDGEAGFREARDFMRMLTPSQARKVQPWREDTPLFMARKVEDHLAQIYSSTVPLKSGGYLVINQTEALVAIDVNSGRATRERNIEATALRTNLEAAEEAARQLRLRDLAGLIVIDFIDMDEAKNNRAVEKVLKDCLARDRARIQMGRISPFGLMEISRQRRRTGILEGTTNVCPHCHGAGRIRSVESSALAALRAVEMEAVRGGGEIRLTAAKDSGLYILNHKREHLLRLAHRQALLVTVALDDSLEHADHQIERLSDIPYVPPAGIESPPRGPGAPAAAVADDDEDTVLADDEPEAGPDAGTEPAGADAGDLDIDNSATPTPDGEFESGRRRRRRRRGRGEDAAHGEALVATPHPSPEPADTLPSRADGGAGRRRRRGRRGGRGPREQAQGGDVYGWSWPARLSGEDTYEWRGPAAAGSALTGGGGVEIEPSPAEASLSDPGPMAADATNLPGLEIGAIARAETEGGEQPLVEVDPPEIWVELPAASDAAPRRGRGRARTGRSRSGAVAPTAEARSPADKIPAKIAPASTVGSEAAVEATAEPAATPLTIVASQDPPPASAARRPDPNEISTPPTAPRRGWWRRGI